MNVNELDEEYNKIARKVLYGHLSDKEYDEAIEKLQKIELEIMKEKLITKKS